MDILRTRSRGHVGVRVVIELSYVLRGGRTSEAAEDRALRCVLVSWAAARHVLHTGAVAAVRPVFVVLHVLLAVGR